MSASTHNTATSSHASARRHHLLEKGKKENELPEETLDGRIKTRDGRFFPSRAFQPSPIPARRQVGYASFPSGLYQRLIPGSRPAASFSRLVAIPAINRPVATRFKRHCCGLSATRTNHRCCLCCSGTVAGAPLIVLLGLPASLATLRGRVTAFLKERLIGSGEGKLTPTVAALKLYISRHGNPRFVIVSRILYISRKFSFKFIKLAKAPIYWMTVLCPGAI